MKLGQTIIPITEEVSVDSIFIEFLLKIAYPNTFEFIEIMDKVITETVDKTYKPRLSISENEKRAQIYYYQKMWNLLLEKGRDDNV